MTPPRLVLVTDRHATGGEDLVRVVRRALDAGLPAVQLRDKDLPARQLLVLAEALRAATARARAAFFVNDRIDVALAVGADGVHLGTASLPVAVARGLLPADALIGVSTHSTAELADAAGADFAFFGPLYATPRRPTPQGEARLHEAVRGAAIPVLAIGGVTPARVRAVLTAGAWGVAVVRAILGAEDPAAATRALLAALG